MSLDIIVQFVERKIPTEEFIEKLYNNEELERVLSENIVLSPFTYLGETAYLYLLNQDLNTPGGLLNSLSALEEFLQKKHIAFTKNNEASKLYSLLLKVQPNWIDIPNWYMKKLQEISDDKKGKDLESFLKEKIRQDFRYSKKPPKWLQSAQWLYRKEIPLLFVGQMDITEIRHDTAQLYIFYDEINNEFHFIEQTA
ncbi:MAG: hypothetical protein FWH57_05580 [Oscillospiraceae bacterium]|nr:hypothetical protein [Oscillospiraceae bacterium]